MVCLRCRPGSRPTILPTSPVSACCVACWNLAVARARTSTAARARCSRSRSSASSLVDIHGQHEHQSLLRASRATRAARCVRRCDRPRRSRSRRRGATGRSCGASASSGRRTPRRLLLSASKLEWQVQELTRLAFSADEWETLQADHRRLAHAAGLIGSGRIRGRGAVRRRGGGAGRGQRRGFAPATQRRDTTQA